MEKTYPFLTIQQLPQKKGNTMADKPQTFTERLRVDLGAVSSQWKQLEATARSLTAPRQMSSPNAVNEVRHAALAMRALP